ncbi:MBL fold metallo-hydrolase [Sporolactobacillus shoreicorticis]|uniref:MBL fold metallo-hydrolase n=1 Tax=Sporolactobacillus shoreicorticis TaxID=1923877 RepID=A0ABW5S5U9_9BACL|nr:MBL fold metallo-hydrolase [Sporolactobacillus shoreicorticis]MCO7127775.1 MBL fold metallo-hydrolase [Sporolactobacillus shoreicorticis]
MIDIKALASGSKGNAYRITDGQTPLLLECGIPYREIQKGFDFHMSDVAGCLITHEHGDHSKSVKDVMKGAVDLYASQGTFTKLGIAGHHVKPIRAREQFKLRTWTIMPFDVEHDVSEPLGYLLMNQSGEKLLFATDTYYIKYKFKNLTHVMVEANYSLEILNENIKAGRVPAVMKRRLLRSHFSLEHVNEFLSANDLSMVQEIWLLHLSDNNSNAEQFKREIMELTGKPVYIA